MSAPKTTDGLKIILSDDMDVFKVVAQRNSLVARVAELEAKLAESVPRAHALAAAHICYRVGNHGIRNTTIEQCKKNGTLKLLLTLPDGIDNDAELRMKPLAIEALKYVEENWP